MGSHTIRFTCPECGYVLRLEHAITTSKVDSLQVLFELDRSTIEMHTCLRNAS